MSNLKRVAIIVGLGAGGGTGAASARAFAKEGYSIALIARGGDSLKTLEESLKESGVEASSFQIKSYSAEELKTAFENIKTSFAKPTYEIRFAVWNASYPAFKPFLNVTLEDVRAANQVVEGAFAFSRDVILSFNDNELDTNGSRGTLVFTGATSSIRGGPITSGFSPQKQALRALSQSLNKEFGQKNIHIAHVIIDGLILTPLTKGWKKDAEWEANQDARLSPESIGASYVYIANQDRSAWTWELDLRPAHEQWTW